MNRGLRMWVGLALITTTLASCMAAPASTRVVPLTDLNVGERLPQKAGLYGSGSHVPPPAQMAAAKQVLGQIAILAHPLVAQAAARTDSPAPFRVIGDIYYVGDRRVSSYLFASPEGHILIDAGWPDSGPSILHNIVELGFDPRDLRYLLITHPHPDHLGSAKFLRAQTGAKIGLHAADVQAAERADQTRFDPFQVDLHLAEGDVIGVGNQQIHIYHTPGHTPGTLTFGFTVREDGKEYRGLVFGAAGVTVFSRPGARERNVPGGTLEDLIKSLDRVAAMPVDIWLETHPHKNDTFEKYRRLKQGETPNPFVDPQGWKTYLANCRERAEQLR